MEFLALLGLGGGGAAAIGTQFLESIWENFEIFKNIYQLIGYHSRIEEKRKILERRLESLCSVENDIKLELSEFRSGKKRKREVENWLRSVERKKNDVLGIEKQIGERKYSLGPWWETRLEKNIQQVEELYEKGNFDSIFLDAYESSGKELLTTRLVCQNSNGEVLERILKCVKDDETLRIGVYGVEGVGKTAIMMHVHNELLRKATFGNVYWFTASEDFSIHKLQNEIAKEVGLDFDDEDKRKRAAKLHKGILRRKKCVIILDGLSSYFDQDDVGVPSQVNGCKLIVTTRSLRLCRRMDCQEAIKIEPLSVAEAEMLFKAKLKVKNSVTSGVEEIAKEIVKECEGLPSKIIGVAEEMRGVDDVSEWRYKLNELRECRGVFND